MQNGLQLMTARPYQNHSEGELLQMKTMFQGQITQLQRERDRQIRVTKDQFHESVREIGLRLEGVYNFIGEIERELTARRPRLR